MLFLYQNIYYTGKCSKVSLKAFTLNNQWSFGVDPKYPLVDLPNLQTFTISTQMQTFTERDKKNKCTFRYQVKHDMKHNIIPFKYL